MIFFSFAFLYAYLQVIYGPNSKFLNTYSKYSLHFEGKNIKYQKYWKLCSKSWFYVDIFLSWKITATHIDFSPNLSIENRYLCIKNSKMQGQNKRYTWSKKKYFCFSSKKYWPCKFFNCWLSSYDLGNKFVTSYE